MSEPLFGSNRSSFLGNIDQVPTFTLGAVPAVPHFSLTATPPAKTTSLRFCMTSSPHEWKKQDSRSAKKKRDYLESGLWADCVFVVGPKGNQEKFKAHRILLALASPVFEAMLVGVMRETGEKIDIPDVQPDAFRALLRFIYADTITIQSLDDATDLWYAAKKYMLNAVETECKNYLANNIKNENACHIYELAMLYEDKDLENCCVRFISRNITTILEEPSFENIELPTLERILELDTLNVTSELELCSAVQRWATSECKRKEVLLDMEVIKSVLSTILTKIRFLSLTPAQFAEGIDCCPFLSDKEIVALLLNMSSAKTPRSIPSNFSPCRVKRKVDNGKLKGGECFCVRKILFPTLSLSKGYMECAVSFQVDSEVEIVGFQIPTQVTPEDPGLPIEENDTYSESNDVSLKDSKGAILKTISKSSDVKYGSNEELVFDESVTLTKNTGYELVVIKNSKGWYPSGLCVQKAHCSHCTFVFNGGKLNSSVHEGLMGSIIFRH